MTNSRVMPQAINAYTAMAICGFANLPAKAET